MMKRPSICWITPHRPEDDDNTYLESSYNYQFTGATTTLHRSYTSHTSYISQIITKLRAPRSLDKPYEEVRAISSFIAVVEAVK